MTRLSLLLVAVLACSVAAVDAKPNVVVFLADDAGWGDYGHSGNQLANTPHVDSIAKEGVTIDRFFVEPVCSPTRAEFLTGRYHGRMGVSGTSLGEERMDLDENTVADAFHAAGYATGAFGKWHNGSQWPYYPMARGFDEYFGHPAGHWGEYFNPELEDAGHMVRTEGYIVDICTDRALAFIEKNQEKPFFCYLPFTTPHSPWAAPEENWSHFKDQPVEQRSTLPDQEDLNETRCAMAMLENQDMNVGRVLAKLEELGLTEDTIVIYFSDNGPNSWRWTDGMKGRKGSTDEGGVRSVCYWRWPAKIPAGHTVTQIAGAIDFLPTLTSLAEVPRVGDKPLDGRDLSPLLLKQQTEWPDRRIFNAWNGKVSVRTQTHRLDDKGQLFDMIADPGQTEPVNKKETELAKALMAEVKAWRKDVLGPEAADPAKNKTKHRAVDPRPFPVGYPEFPNTILPARDGEPIGEVTRSTRAPNSSYFVNWKTKEDRMEWNVEVHTAGRYAVTIDYTCPVADAGSTVELSFNGAKVSGKVAPGWDPPLYTNQDTLPRPPAESQMKEFHTLTLGEVELRAGQGPLVLRATDIPGDYVMDVRRVTLTLLE